MILIVTFLCIIGAWRLAYLPQDLFDRHDTAAVGSMRWIGPTLLAWVRYGQAVPMAPAYMTVALTMLFVMAVLFLNYMIGKVQDCALYLEVVDRREDYVAFPFTPEQMGWLRRRGGGR